MDKSKLTIGILTACLISSLGFNAYQVYSIESLSVSSTNSIKQLNETLAGLEDELEIHQTEKLKLTTDLETLKQDIEKQQTNMNKLTSDMETAQIEYEKALAAQKSLETQKTVKQNDSVSSVGRNNFEYEEYLRLLEETGGTTEDGTHVAPDEIDTRPDGVIIY